MLCSGLLQAREDAAREARKAWAEEKQGLQSHIAQLQDVISQLQGETPVSHTVLKKPRSHILSVH